MNVADISCSWEIEEMVAGAARNTISKLCTYGNRSR